METINDLPDQLLDVDAICEQRDKYRDALCRIVAAWDGMEWHAPQNIVMLKRRIESAREVLDQYVPDQNLRRPRIVSKCCGAPKHYGEWYAPDTCEKCGKHWDGQYLYEHNAKDMP